MNPNEACHKIDQWLLVPIDYNDVLESLAEIRNTDRYDRYVAKVAEAEFKSVAEVRADVDSYASTQYGRYDALNEKLSKISGNKINSSRYSREEDIHDEIERDRNGIVDPQKQLNARYSSYVQNRMVPDADDAPLIPERKHYSIAPVYCSQCGSVMLQEKQKEGMTCGQVFLCVLFGLIFLPLILIPILFMRKEKTIYRCPKCGRIHA